MEKLLAAILLYCTSNVCASDATKHIEIVSKRHVVPLEFCPTPSTVKTNIERWFVTVRLQGGELQEIEVDLSDWRKLQARLISNECSLKAKP